MAGANFSLDFERRAPPLLGCLGKENNAVDRFLFTAHYFPTTENRYIHT